MMRAIVKRETVMDVTVRFLECSHTQEEPNGGKADVALVAFCKQCSANAAREAKSHKPKPTPPPGDARSELQRLADDVDAAWHPPAGRAWSRGDVAIRKLVQAARAHACRSPQSNPQPENV